MKKQNSNIGGVPRRRFIKWGLAGLAGAVVLERAYDYLSESSVKARIVIVGGGTAGITMAAYLTDMLRYDDITIIDPNSEHYYQPGYTLIAGGVFEPEEVVRSTKSLLPRDVKWIQDSVTELNPDNNSLQTASHGRFSYDFLVLVPGCEMDFNAVKGVTREELGKDNVHCIYDFKGAIACRDGIRKLPDLKEGRLIFTDTYTKLKCGGAPKKICLMTEDYLRDRDLRSRFEIEYYANDNEIMKPKIFGDRLATIFKDRDVAVKFRHRLASVDGPARKAVFHILPKPSGSPLPADAKYEQVTVEFDLLHFVPPMSAPGFARNSDLVDTSKSGGWLAVNKDTLIHPKYRNIITFGDAAGLPTSKTGAAIRKQAPVAAANLLALINGKEPRAKYNGYSACPIVTEYGKVLMAEFGYDEKLMPSLPWFDPAMERGIWWALKVHGLKPMYFHGMLRGWL